MNHSKKPTLQRWIRRIQYNMAKRGRPPKVRKVSPQDLVEHHDKPLHFGQVTMWNGKRKTFEFELERHQFHPLELLDNLHKYTKIKGSDVLTVEHYGISKTMINTIIND